MSAQPSRGEVDAVLRRALPPRRRASIGVVLGVFADLCVVGLLALSMWLIVRAGEQPPILHLTFAIVGVRALAIGRAACRYAGRRARHDAARAPRAAPLTTRANPALPLSGLCHPQRIDCREQNVCRWRGRKPAPSGAPGP